MSEIQPKLTESELQRLVSEFVSREVIYCVSSLIYELGQDPEYADKFHYENILSRPTYYGECPDCEKYHDGILDKDLDGARRYKCTGRITRKGSNPEIDVTVTQPCGCWFEPDEEIEKAYEHWIISNWLADKLEAKGEMVTKDFLGLTIWGRTCTGQSIMLDGVIREIYSETR